MFRIPRIFRNGSWGIAWRVVSVRWAVASPIISRRRITASCFSVLLRKSASVMLLKYETMSRAACSMSRRMSGLVRIHIRRSRWRGCAPVPSDLVIAPATNEAQNPPERRPTLPPLPPFQAGCRQKPVSSHRASPTGRRHSRAGLSARNRAENFESPNVMFLAERAQPFPEFACRLCHRHTVRISFLSLRFKDFTCEGRIAN